MGYRRPHKTLQQCARWTQEEAGGVGGCFRRAQATVLIVTACLRLFLRTDSSPLENSDVNKCGAVEYPCPSGEFRRFSLRDALKQKYTATVREVVGRFRGSIPEQHTNRRRGKFFTEGVPAGSNYGSNLITNSGPFHCRTQRRT